MRLIEVALVLSCLTGLAACGAADRPAARAKSIGTDLSADGVDVLRLYWVRGEVLFRGECRSNFAVISDCQNHLQSVEYNVFKKTLSELVTLSSSIPPQEKDKLPSLLIMLESPIHFTIQSDLDVFNAYKGVAALFDLAFDAAAT